MKTDYRILAIILTFVMIFVCVSCMKPASGSDPAGTEPTVTEAPAATDEPTATDEPAATAEPAPEAGLPVIIGHYVLLEGGALYDLNTGKVAATGVKEFIPGSLVNLAILTSGELIGWHEVESSVNLCELLDLEYHHTPVHILDDIVKAEPGCALNKDGQLIVWGGELAPGSWNDYTDEQKIEYSKPRVLIENAADMLYDLVLLKDGTLIDTEAYKYGLVKEPKTIDTGVADICGRFVYLKEDGSLVSIIGEKQTIAGNVARVYANDPCEYVYYTDSEGSLRKVDLYGVGPKDALLANVVDVSFDRMVGENFGCSYAFAITSDGELWSVEDYFGADPVRIADGAKDVISDGTNIYVLMNDNSLWAYTAWYGVYTADLESRPVSGRSLVKLMDGVAACGVEMDMEDNGEKDPCRVHSTFRAVTEDNRIFVWGFVDGETVSSPTEIYLMK